VRYIQCPLTNKLVPADEYYRPRISQHAIHGDLTSFVSPIDGTVISDRKQYDEHCKRHGVVNAAEFSPEYYTRRAEERAAVYEGRSTREETQKRRENINEIMNHHERNGRRAQTEYQE
jgi:hypothetical protein